MSSVHDLFTNINTVLSSDFTRISFQKVSIGDVNDTELPMLLVPTLKTNYNKNGNSDIYQTIVEASLVIILACSANDPLKDLEDKQDVVFRKLSTDRRVRDIGIFELKSSTISNSVKQYEAYGRVSCLVECEFILGESRYV